MADTVSMPLDIIDRMWRAPVIVHERLIRAVRALEAAGLPYAVVGGHAIAHWVATVDEGAVRNTPDVNILVLPADRLRARAVLEAAGFQRSSSTADDCYLDGAVSKLSRGVCLYRFGERIGATDAWPAPEVGESIRGAEFQVLGLEPLVRMKLVAHRSKDRVHIRDLIGVGLIDISWPEKFPPPLDARLREILADPNG